jgi:hypothetical protein
MIFCDLCCSGIEYSSELVQVDCITREEISEFMDGFRLERATRDVPKTSARTKVTWTVWAVKSGEDLIQDKQGR